MFFVIHLETWTDLNIRNLNDGAIERVMKAIIVQYSMVNQTVLRRTLNNNKL